MDRDILDRAEKIKLVIFDVDGVLTDGRLYFDHEGREYKTFHARDGLGLRFLREFGIEMAVISGRRSDIVERRLRAFGITLIYQGYEEKLAAFERILKERPYSLAEIAYVGDDLLDLPVMRRVGLAIAVQDAHVLVKQQAHWVTALPGGRGAVREVCDLLLEAQGHLEALKERYLSPRS